MSMKKKIIYDFYFLTLLGSLIIYVKANKGIFGYNEFSNFEWKRTPENKESECVTWNIENFGKNINEHFLSVIINPGCSKGLSFQDTSEVGFFSAFQYYSALEIDLLVLEGKLDIKLEDPESDVFTTIESLDASEFNSEDINTYNFTFFNIPFPEEQDGEFFIIDFSNPDPEKSVKFYMRQARLINITPRPILDNQRLYGNDWSYDIINSTFINNVMHKHMRPYGCISIDIHPYIGPWSSIRFEMKAPPDLIIRVNVELETIQDLMTYVNPSVDSIHWNEDTWTTVEVKLKDFIYNKLYDRLDICNQKSYNSWIKVRNIYLEPTYKFDMIEKTVNSCCVFNQCICTIQRKKIYIRRNATIPDSELSNENKNNGLILYPNVIPLIISLLLIKLLFN